MLDFTLEEGAEVGCDVIVAFKLLLLVLTLDVVDITELVELVTVLVVYGTVVVCTGMVEVKVFVVYAKHIPNIVKMQLVVLAVVVESR